MKRKIALSVLIMTMIFATAAYALDLSGFSKHFNALKTAVGATAKAARPISDDEEYYVGRAVAARILGAYRLSDNQDLTKYINLIGRTVALASERPFTYGGYHLAVLDTDEMNAFACPGGIIFITKGMIKMTENEEELAAVIAHEVAHVNKRDGIATIKSSRWTEALTVIGTEAAKTYSPSEIGSLVKIFEGSIDDVFKTLVVNGYSKAQELAADVAALEYLAKSGYDPRALNVFLKHLADKGGSSGGGITKTHPGTQDRIDNIKDKLPSEPASQQSIQRRTARFGTVQKTNKP